MNLGIQNNQRFFVRIDSLKLKKKLLLTIPNFYVEAQAYGITIHDTISLKKINSKTTNTFEVPLEVKQIYLDISSYGMLYLSFSFIDKPTYENNTLYTRLFQGLLVGVILVFAFLSLIFLKLFKHKLSGYYFIYLISSFFLFISISGTILSAFEINVNQLIRITFISLTCYYITISIISNLIIGLKGKVYFYFKYTTGIIVLSSILMWFLPIQIGIYYNNVVPILMMVAISTLAILKYRKTKAKNLLFYLLGWLIYFLGAGSMALLNLGILSPNLFTTNSPYLGFIFEAVFFTIAVFYTIKEQPTKSIDLSIFSEREKEVIDLLIKGRTNKEMAETLYVSTNTIKFHLSNIYEKSKVKNKAEAISFFLNQ